MELLGISCGRRMGNSEILLREALMGAAELGVDTEVLSLLDVDVKPCIGCKVCQAEITGKEDCVIKDDAVFRLEQNHGLRWADFERPRVLPDPSGLPAGDPRQAFWFQV